MLIAHYLTSDKKDLFQEWLDRLRDIRVRVAIQRRVERLVHGNFGDHKFCRDGVWELRIDVGPGYRVYYALYDKSMVVLLCAGDKRKQDADINRAIIYWNDFLKRVK